MLINVRKQEGTTTELHQVNWCDANKTTYSRLNQEILNPCKINEGTKLQEIK